VTQDRETIGGVPLGLSRDYEHLPQLGPLRPIRCQCCSRLYDDVERLTEDGCRVMAIMCASCREEGRSRWLAAQIKSIELPQATASYRKGDR
jgi:hypothetical protein